MIPGRSLHRLASYLCSETSLERVVEPAIADLQREYANAATSRARRIFTLISDYFVILWLIGLSSADPREATEEERVSVRRTLAWACVLTTAATVLLVLPPLSNYPELSSWFVVLTVVPQALPLAIPIGLAFAIAFGLSARISTTTTKAIVLASCVASVMSFGTFAWLLPAGNQAFRDRAIHAIESRADRDTARRAPKGVGEMTLSELRHEMRNAAAAGESRAAWLPSWSFHLRFTLPAAVIVIAAFLLAVPVDRRLFRGMLAFAACVLYWALICIGQIATRSDYLAPFAGAWLPNIVFVVAALLVVSSRTSRLRADGFDRS